MGYGNLRIQGIIVALCSQTLHLSLNKISHIDEDAFKNTTALENLLLVGNLLTSLPPIVDLCDSLRTLDVTSNDIQIIPDAYFARCFNMAYFRIGRNKLTMIDNNTFVGLISIGYLGLSYNMITKITGDVIWDHPALHSLQLDGNKLTQLPSLSTDGIPELKYLSVADNKIRNISEKEVSHLQNLTTLDFSNNLITDVEFIFTLPNIQQIHFGNNLIPINENLLNDFKHLTSVELSGSGLLSFPLLLPSKNTLTSVKLSQNQIRCVDVLHLVNMTKLQTLYLSDNDIEMFPDVGCKDGNESAKTFHDLEFPSLCRFGIARNQLTRLTSDALSKMPVLEHLDASSNEIIDMPFLSFVGISLRYVYLDRNEISHLEGRHLLGLYRLEVLGLSDNNIGHLDLHVLASLTNLRWFDLRYNKLTTPPMAMETSLSPFMNIMLGNNPYICDSRLLADLFIDGLLCNTPLKFAGQTIEYAREAIIRGKYTLIVCLT